MHRMLIKNDSYIVLYIINLVKKRYDASGSNSGHKDFHDRHSSLTNRVNEGILAGRKIAKISVITLISIGAAELIMAYFSGSVVAFADGVDSLSDAMISFIVYVGLGFAGRPADKTISIRIPQSRKFCGFDCSNRNDSHRMFHYLPLL